MTNQTCTECKGTGAVTSKKTSYATWYLPCPSCNRLKLEDRGDTGDRPICLSCGSRPANDGTLPCGH
jgi:DnaJ-class molecular chaperone